MARKVRSTRRSASTRHGGARKTRRRSASTRHGGARKTRRHASVRR